MDEVRNPFAPGAGSRPPELAGRDDIIAAAQTAIVRVVARRSTQSQILLGLRGVGKTVLLNAIQEIADRNRCITSFIEAPESNSLVDLLYPRLFRVLRQLSFIEKSKHAAHAGLKALKSFASAFKIKVGDIEIAVEPEPGSADSGNLEYDLSELFLRVGHAAADAGVGWILLVDEVQYLNSEELAALIVALHRVSQKGLPVLFFGAGLPQLAALAGEAKSYAERLFLYPHVGALDPSAAREAIRGPVETEGETIADAALDRIAVQTERYPYFLQEWGYQAWNAADASPIDLKDIEVASVAATRRLDEGFFKVRFDRLTPKEREYVIAMATLGKGPYRSSDVADILKLGPNSLGPRRASIIAKGIIYSPAYGDIDFTVPMFEGYLKRNWMKTV